MKKVVFLMALLLCAACQQRVQQQFVEEECEGQDTIDQSLIFKTTDSITYHTTVMYAGEHMQGDFVMSAMYGLDEFNSMGEYLLTPEVDVFQITMHLKHKGAHKPETIVLVTDGKPQRIEPNFTQAVAKGEFMLLFNISLYNNTQSVPKHIINAKSVQVKVRYNNGDAVYNVTNEDRKAVETMYKSFLKDGGKDYSAFDDIMEEHQKKQQQK
ncbi:MAG: hypothetical protein J5733_08665 [Bacteroidaceae bacterium]|nr:hypothetical protein [Bacteroidaceae bacterium]